MNNEIKLLFFSLAIFLLVCCSCHKDIPQTKHYPNGNVEELCYLRNGELSGSYKAYYEDGTLHGEGQFRKGRPVGVWHYYYPNGDIMTIEKHNRKGKTVSFDAWDEEGRHVVQDGTGTIVKHYPDGSIESRVGYKDCMFEGTNEAWFPNGQKRYEFFYKNGKPVGTWRFWNDEGELVREEEY
ncbi:MAG: toxin-antitoxin system YwqK family antitoxin [Bacteroidales bacterium]|nr:toxin-antitoxin system YwqK family antitoxin [Bacteroidales bacterium]